MLLQLTNPGPLDATRTAPVPRSVFFHERSNTLASSPTFPEKRQVPTLLSNNGVHYSSYPLAKYKRTGSVLNTGISTS